MLNSAVSQPSDERLLDAYSVTVSAVMKIGLWMNTSS